MGRTFVGMEKELFITEKIFREKVFERVLSGQHICVTNL